VISNLFVRAISLSISGSLIAIIILIISPKIKFKLSNTWQYYIWLAVILRMILPYAPKISLMGGFYQLLDNNSQILNAAADISTNETFEMIIQYIGFVWLIAVSLLIAKKVTSYLVYTRSIRANLVEIADPSVKQIYNQVCYEMCIETNIGLYSHKRISSPMLIGFFKPCVVLPEAMLQTTEGLKYIFMHELSHHKRKDFLYKWLIQIISCVYFFNPIIYMVKKKIIDYCEFSCDESVIKRLDNHGKAAYGSALIESLEINAGLKQNAAASLMLCEDAVQIKERLAAIMRHQKSSKLITVSTFILTGVICFSSFFIGVFNNIFSNGVCYCLGTLLNLCSLCR
jgi:beta-lactamase regulating signal transducer with metallopeptidase domain